MGAYIAKKPMKYIIWLVYASKVNGIFLEDRERSTSERHKTSEAYVEKGKLIESRRF
jgi:hypothetical protein